MRSLAVSLSHTATLASAVVVAEAPTVRPVVTAAEMRAADERRDAHRPHEALVERAGLAAAIGAVRLVPRVYGTPRRGAVRPGVNGADGRVAARHLSSRGAAVRVLEATAAPPTPRRRRPRRRRRLRHGAVAQLGRAARRPGGAGARRRPAVRAWTPTRASPRRRLRATRTVAMGALKRGHLLADGALLSGVVEVAPLGIEVQDATCALVEDDDLDAIPPLARDDHKWRRAVVVVAGARACSARRARLQRRPAVQAGMVLLCAPDVPRRREGPWPQEVVRLAASAQDAEKVVVDALDRARALVIGPGLGRSARLQRLVVDVLRATREPVVLDADALHLVDADLLSARQERGGSPIVLTPHDGEFAALFGAPPGTDRFAAALRGARRTGCTVLLKGRRPSSPRPPRRPGSPTCSR